MAFLASRMRTSQAGVLTVVEFLHGGLAGDDLVRDVGDDCGDPIHVSVGETQLCAGVRMFRVQDHRRVFGPGGPAEQTSHINDSGAVPDPVTGLDRGRLACAFRRE